MASKILFLLAFLLFLFANPSVGQLANEQQASTESVRYLPTDSSLSQHPLPAWYQDAKLGIFIHWGLYSVPAWAKGTKTSLEDILANGDGLERFANNPYAEWHLNSLRIEGSSTAEYHQEAFGPDFSYYNFVPRFNEAIRAWQPAEWAELFKEIGAGYVVLTTKHHDGFLLWPSDTPNSYQENYFIERDLVGELTQAVTDQGMRMGLYYSSGLD